MNYYRLEIPLGVLYAPIALASSATAVVGVPNKRIVLISASIIASAAVNVKWQTSTGPLDLSGLAYLAQNGGYILPFNAGGWLETLFGDSLLLNLNPNVPIGGNISYVLDGK
jgi:hypothetical protein